MREIKIRVWDKKAQAWRTNVDFTCYAQKEGANWVWRFPALGRNNEEVIASEFTGLKDKNGVEIFEGDILKNLSDANIKVCWDKVGLWAAIDIDDGEDFGLLYNCQVHQYEIVGNIYDNPELLEAGEVVDG